MLEQLTTRAYLGSYRKNALVGHPWKSWNNQAEAILGRHMPGGQSRWSNKQDLSWELLRAELVAEVAYEQMQNRRFRHVAHIRRWRLDKKPHDCTYEQLEVIPPQELTKIFVSR